MILRQQLISAFKEFSNLKMTLAQSTKEEKTQEVEWSSYCIYNAGFIY